VHVYITKLYRQQAEVIQNNENVHVPNINQGVAQHGNITGINLAAVKHKTVHVTGNRWKPISEDW
jgi:hypothetical protein